MFKYTQQTLEKCGASVIIHKYAFSYFFHLLFYYKEKQTMTTLEKENTAYSLRAKSLKKSFVTFE